MICNWWDNKNLLNSKNIQILAPAQDKNTFLAAIAAGADAIYCGLKIFSARMTAQNFSIEELARLSKFAKSKNIKIHIAFNSIIKESETKKAFNLISKLCEFVDFDVLIIQDLAIIDIAKKAGFKKEFALSTLGNISFASALEVCKKAGFSKIVLPRELNIDQIKSMANQVPKGIKLEVFVHGALCYCVSGRCYWSSWFGGKSSLRGRCVQPCRRIYEQKSNKQQHFSCLDFSSDVLAKILKQINNISTWKIEGRKKGPHYVYNTVKAYKILRDEPERKKEALLLLDYAMGRQFTHYNLLPQSIQNPLEYKAKTGSGLFIGKIRNPENPYFITKEELLPFDLLRIGFEDEPSHAIIKVNKKTPPKFKFYLGKQYTKKAKANTPAFIIDRRQPELIEKINYYDSLLEKIEKVNITPVTKEFKVNKNNSLNRLKQKSRSKTIEVIVTRNTSVQSQDERHDKNHDKRYDKGLWISSNGYSIKPLKNYWLWLDPVIFPDEENICRRYIDQAIKKGAKNFVLNSFSQISFFKSPEILNIWAGPFLNLTNALSINFLKRFGFCGAIISPELDKENCLSLPKKTNMPLGIVIYANWPLGISRIISKDIKLNQPFKSPKQEIAWVAKFNNNFHIFPNWALDLTSEKTILEKAGFCLFATMQERVPKNIKIKTRQGLWNWNLKLL